MPLEVLIQRFKGEVAERVVRFNFFDLEVLLSLRKKNHELMARLQRLRFVWSVWK